MKSNASPPPKSVEGPARLRVLRLTQLVAHLFRGLATTWTVFPKVDGPTRRQHVRTWSGKLLTLAGVRVRVVGEPLPPENFVIVANHISWVDIFAINSLRAVSFVAKKELASWPVAGRLLKNVGTLFIDRSKRRDTGRMVAILAQHIREGEPLAFFPEGGVSHGVGVRQFNASLLQPVVDAKAWVVPIAISYAPLASFDYVNRNFLQSVWAILGAHDAEVTLTLLPMQHGENRRELAKSLENAIRLQIHLSVAAKAPETRADRPTAAP
jgi:1-acyl-sn-glycerol-3-phosphate acyltransferase